MCHLKDLMKATLPIEFVKIPCSFSMCKNEIEVPKNIADKEGFCCYECQKLNKIEIKKFNDYESREND